MNANAQKWRFVVVIACVLLSACVKKISIPATVKQVSNNGIHIMQTVQAMATAVETAEEAKRIPRNQAIKVMVTLSKITDAAQQVVKYLTLILTSDSPTELSSTVDKIVAALETINVGLFQAFIPIQDETLKTDLSSLASEMGGTIAIINREILGRAYTPK